MESKPQVNIMNTFEQYESEVRSYCRSFPVVFSKAKGASLFTEDGREYIDFLAGAGTLNYGHNHPELKQALLDYIDSDGLTHGLDMHSSAKENLITTLQDVILKPRGLNNYVIQFTGPTGTNCVEAALKLARKKTGRETVIAFTNGFHGVSGAALSCTGNQHHRGGAGTSLHNVVRMPYAGYFGEQADTLAMMDKMLDDPSSGIDQPAAVILEVIQGEGGLNSASAEWLRKLRKLCDKHGMLMIIDDIQAGCGRSGDFFSFEFAGIKPDIITLSKSLSGFGLPLAVTVFRKDLDIWKPGEHNGTFRGNNHAFVTASKTLRAFWQDDQFSSEIKEKGQMVRQRMRKICDRFGPASLHVKGRCMMSGIECPDGELADAVVEESFKRGLVIETCGNQDQVVKCFAPLTISHEKLSKGMDILEQAFAAASAKATQAAAS